MRNFRCLFLGAGKRVSLLKRFGETIEALSFRPQLFSYEKDCLQPVSKVSTVIEGLPWKSERIEDHLAQTIEELEIDLVISCVDPATVVHANLAKRFHSASIVNTPELTLTCLSKKRFQARCEELDLNVIPRSIPNEYPCFAKPDIGSASIGACKIDSQDQVNQLDVRQDYLLQKLISGDEYTVDCYVSTDGRICAISPRKRVLTLGGESVITETFRDHELQSITVEVIEKLGLVGPLTIQFIKQIETQQTYLMEVNPRFAGGVVASIHAGFNFPSMMIQEILGIPPKEVQKGRRILMKRYFSEAFFEIGD